MEMHRQSITLRPTQSWAMWNCSIQSAYNKASIMNDLRILGVEKGWNLVHSR